MPLGIDCTKSSGRLHGIVDHRGVFQAGEGADQLLGRGFLAVASGGLRQHTGDSLLRREMLGRDDALYSLAGWAIVRDSDVKVEGCISWIA